MTGLDRLRELADDVIGSVWANTSSIYCKKYGLSVDSTGGSFSDFLRQIADQIEAEQEERITRRLEDREAAEWVRDHGGLESVKNLLNWVIGHCSTKQQLDFDFWLSGRVMYELGFDEDMADRDEVERRLLARLMPEGMEWLVEAWPRFEGGRPVRFSDDLERNGDEYNVGAVTLYRNGNFALNFLAYSKGERVNRPASFDPDRLTHERPESWERLEEDVSALIDRNFECTGAMQDYVDERGVKCPHGILYLGVVQDVLRRAKALAERERGE